jgi:hypothetical protein
VKLDPGKGLIQSLSRKEIESGPSQEKAGGEKEWGGGKTKPAGEEIDDAGREKNRKIPNESLHLAGSRLKLRQ